MARRVSVCIPTYRPTAHLVDAIESVLGQTFREFELILVDDGSQDDWSSLLALIVDPRLRIVRFPSNVGLAANWNRCLDEARGELISIFHQDDVMKTPFLEKTVAALDANPEAGFAYTNIERIDEHGERIGGHYIDQPEQDDVFSGEDLYSMIARTGNPIACPAVLARASCYEEYGRFDTRFDFAADQDLWMRFLRSRSAAFVSEPLLAHRVHRNQQSARFAGSGRDYLEVLAAFDRSFGADLPDSLRAHASATYATLARQSINMARWKLRGDRLGAALRYFRVFVAARRRSITA